MIADVTASRGPTVRVLGPVELVGPAGGPVRVGGGKPATVLATLALHAGDWVSTDQLVDLVWPDREPPASATNNLKTYVWQLRRLLTTNLGTGRIEARHRGYRLGLEPGDLDADVLAATAHQAGESLRDGQADELAARLPDVLGLWRGRPYDEIADHCAHPAFARLHEQHCTLREQLAEAYLLLGRTTDAIELLTALTAEEPLRELALAKLIDALRRAGRVRDALTTYQRARTDLIQELGIEPGPQLRAAHQAALGGTRPAPQGWPRPRQLPRPVDLVGRDAELGALVEASRCAGSAVVSTVTGTAGIGKTALAVAAGHALAEHCPDGQLFLDLAGPSRADALGRLIRSVAGPDIRLPDDPDERAALWRSTTYDQRLLLLLDGARDADHVLPLLPASPGCVVLVTSRNRLAGLDERVDIRLAGLTDAAAGQLLHRRAGRLPAEVTADVVRRCAGHPATVRAVAEHLHTSLVGTAPDRSIEPVALFTSRMWRV